MGGDEGWEERKGGRRGSVVIQHVTDQKVNQLHDATEWAQRWHGAYLNYTYRGKGQQNVSVMGAVC